MGNIKSALQGPTGYDEDEMAPLEFTLAVPEEVGEGSNECGDCGVTIGWRRSGVHCVYCGKYRCSKCCAPRKIFGDRPACGWCEGKALSIRRTQMLKDYYQRVGVEPPTANLTPSLLSKNKSKKLVVKARRTVHADPDAIGLPAREEEGGATL